MTGRTWVVAGQSFGAFTAPPVAGYRDAVRKQAARDGGMTGNDDPYVCFFHDVPRDLADEAMRRERGQSDTPMGSPWPLDAWPGVPTRFVLCSEDRFFPPSFFRPLVAERLGITPDEIPGGHCVALSRPRELADLLAGYAT